MIERHSQHVESDKQHDEHIEFFIRDNLEDHRLWPPLKNATFIFIDERGSVVNHNVYQSEFTLGLGIAFNGFFELIFFMAL